MKIASFKAAGAASWGFIDGDQVIDVGAVLGEQYPDLEALLAAEALDAAKAVIPGAPRVALADVVLAPVVSRPGKIFCIGHNYESHRQETGRAKVSYPSVFLRFADTLTAYGAALVRPKESTSLDYEGELAVIIGRGGRRIPEGEAMAHVAGLAPSNDASIRDWQWHTQQFTPGKNFPGTCALGPWMVTLDEIEDLGAVTVTTRLNGQVMQSQPVSDMLFPIPRIIAYISTFTTLSPGDVILTGTPGGVGAKREPPVWMKPGDIVEIDIPGVGLLVNTVADEA